MYKFVYCKDEAILCFFINKDQIKFISLSQLILNMYFSLNA